MTTKETIYMYIQQLDTSAAMGATVNRSKRALLRRFRNREEAGIAYAELIAENEIHQSGTGLPGSPIITVLGPAPVKESIPLPFPINQVSQLALIDFVVRLQETYQERGWSESALDIKAEITKALVSYAPGRPY
jgi:hypothetical protein